jgi:hypothetical protein
MCSMISRTPPPPLRQRGGAPTAPEVATTAVRQSQLRRHLLCVVVAAMTIACGQASSEDAPTEATPTADGGGALDGATVTDGTAQADGVADDGLAIIEDATDSASSNTCPGSAGCTCDANTDCDGGLCIETGQGKRCAGTCVDTCDKGFLCAQVPVGSDVIGVCVDRWARLCAPCTESKDCAHPGITSNRCIDRGTAGNFCGSGCQFDSECPSGHQCKTAKDVDGNNTKQCLPVDTAGELAACQCNANAVLLASKSPCTKTVVDKGVELACTGQAQCKKAAEAATCVADEPETEKCDGVDNDCDGATDEQTCDDGNACSDDSCDAAKGCSQQAASDGVACDADGSVCTVNDSCKAGKCKAGAVKSCSDDNPCTTHSCDLAKGCTQTSDDGAPCSDDNPCTIGDQCKAGGCSPGAVKPCTATGPCYTAACDLVTGKCAFDYAAKGLPCDDGNACTGKDSCDKGKCKGTVGGCNDGNACTADSCDKATGCVHSATKAACEDGDACTLTDACKSKVCTAGALKTCDDGEGCTVDSCDHKTGACQFSGLPMQATACDADGSVCSVGDKCKDGKCLPGASKDCDDNNPCTTDSCAKATGCKHLANTEACDSDGSLCTVGDVCAGKVCTAGTAKTCDDKQHCTEDSCDAKTGKCVHDGGPQQGKACDADGSVCSVGDQCKGGKCTPGAKKSCDDGNSCTTDSCDAKTGCDHLANTETCSDGDSCSLADQCKGKVCGAGATKGCDDKQHCTVDSCDAKTGKCVFAGLPMQASPCDADGSLCTVGDRCKDGKCAPGAKLKCDDNNACTSDACAPTSGCSHAANTAPCSDGNACTLADTCAGKSCTAGKPKVCDDSEGCTVDSCDTKTGNCAYSGLPLHASPCDADGSVCTVGDQCKGGKCAPGAKKSCDDGNPCTDDTCAKSSGCKHLANTAPCNDGNPCTLADTCKGKSCAAGKPRVCDDKEGCTADSCDAKTGQCVHAGLPLQASPCDADGSVCTVGDQCKGGKCAPGAKKSCDDGNTCTKDACHSKKGCGHSDVADKTPCSADATMACASGKCVAVTCPKLTLKNGSVGGGTTAGTKATFKCSSGFALTGPSSVLCKTDGTWAASAPTCNILCTTYSTSFKSSDGWSLTGGTNISGGRINWVSNGNASASFDMHKVLGKGQFVTGDWTLKFRFHYNSTSGGNYNAAEFVGIGDTAGSGYNDKQNFIGIRVHRHNNAKYDTYFGDAVNQTMYANEDSKVSAPITTGQTRDVTITKFGDTASVAITSPKTGAKIALDATDWDQRKMRYIKLNGRWENSNRLRGWVDDMELKVCPLLHGGKLKDCPKLTVANGKVSGGVTIGETAKVVCDKAFKLVGAATLTCDSSAQWSPKAPTCAPICPDNCSGKGSCDVNTGKCSCDKGASGANCGNWSWKEDFSSCKDNSCGGKWSSVSGKNYVSTSGQHLRSTYGGGHIYLDLQKQLGRQVSAEKWVMRFKVRHNRITNSGGHSASHVAYLGDRTDGGGDYAGLNLTDYRTYQQYWHGVSQINGKGGPSCVFYNWQKEKSPSGSWRWLEIRRLSTTKLVYTLFNNAYSSVRLTCTHTLPTGMGALRYFVIRDSGCSGNACYSTSVDIDDIVVHSGVSSVP